MLVRGLIAQLGIVAALYLLVFLNDPYLYILVLPGALLALTLLGFLVWSEVAWRLVPRITRRPLDVRRHRFTAVFVGCLTFCTAGSWLINVQLLPGRFHVASLLGNLLILLYTGFVGRGLVRRSKKAALVRATVAFAFAMAVLTLLGKITVSGNETETLQELTSLPYVGWSAPDTTVRGKGVTLFESEHASSGMNLYADDVSMTVILMGMSGEVLHTWDYGHLVSEQSFPLCVELCENGDLLVNAADRLLVKLDWDSRVVWRTDNRVHHDIAVAGNGDVLTLARKDELRIVRGVPVPVLNDYILVFSSDGEKKGEIPLIGHFPGDISLATIKNIYQWMATPRAIRETISREKALGFALEQSTPADILHTNSIEIIDRDIEGVCRKGNVLLSFRELDLIGVLDLDSEELVWTWGPGEISRQHQPTMLESGNILLFDNGLGRGYSRVVEIDPVSKSIVWTYEAFPAEEFYSKRMGSSQRLPGGGTLITNSESGQVFEITDDHGVVWEYYNPAMRGESRGIIYRMRRITDPGAYAFPEAFAD